MRHCGVSHFTRQGGHRRRARNGLLVDFFSPREIADRVDEVLDHPGRMANLGKTARDDIVTNYNVKDRLAEYERLWRGLLT